ncbi:sodium-dependent transporter [uncultured Phascolarctobacterium sp.]|uniref:sodium-dependent transporter n=1 Tax=uncultured Phascolarctobacterium sp. TaxID=512296 RepID=UPI0026079472|nr:sodium-dependent transporter [uncultured Phascolarctobacterium sp.]
MRKKEKCNTNGSFGSSLGFILACVGSAVGLGNIWMFPYRLGEYGGAAFLLPYLFFIVLFGWVGLAAEFAIGRRARTGTLGAYAYCFAKKGVKGLGKFLGWIPLLGSLGIAIGYAIILGWVLHSLWGAVSGSLLQSNPSEFFAATAGAYGSLLWHSLVIFMTLLVLYFGVNDGIERISKILMPLFFILFVILAVWVFFLPGSGSGYEFLFVPQWEKLLRIDTWIMAMGQAFFSLSITGSGMIVYGAYLADDADIPKASLRTALFDTIAAMLSALAIMPAVFSFGIGADRGPSLIFLTLPKVFQQMPMGQSFAVFFFVAVLFAGITSLINMLEAVSESWQKRFNISRHTSVIASCFLSLAIGIFIEAEPKVGQWMDFVSIIIVPFGAVLGAVSIYYVLGWQDIRQELERGHGALSESYGFTARFVYVPLTVLVMILGLLYGGIG